MNIDAKLQAWLRSHLTLEDALPTQMPVYVNSMAYFFGTATLSALAVVIGSGMVIAIFGPGWWHVSPVGHFFNSVHFWAVEIFYFGLVLHMLAKFFKAAWRDGRWRTWVIGLVTFAVTIFSGITGTLLQENWDAQWNAVQGKDPMNALGLAWMNTMDPGQLLTLHVALFPLLIVLFAAIHIAFVRSESPVRPIVLGSRRGAR
ncbi:MAG: cytochrome b N-terminal domain-containing protein [Betaproteobacteria bacterium]|nr:cytochrome b [Betaproteobacteria bacterium]MDE2003526.1 cytochrome b N-terminal domain-containing protein [Betaproteobacteria bacterium]MDE2208944.1 cytochrome b N-terminal domain-containing protein [Betaproteobacteria bacterium]MDE2360729.1 cytochrome b N-terminal domain-containing protein [Betaproteobacteria bacterium]